MDSTMCVVEQSACPGHGGRPSSTAQASGQIDERSPHRAAQQGLACLPLAPGVERLKKLHLAAGEGEFVLADSGPGFPEAALGRKGGRKRAESMTPERRAEIARKAAQKRWDKG